MARSETRVLTHSDPDFYPVMGPYLANRAVAKSLGGPLWDDTGKTWIVQLDAAGQVTGFIAVTARGKVESLYTLPGRDDLRAALVKAAVKTAGHQALTAVVSHSRIPAYTAAGFTQTSSTANFTTLTRPADGGTP
ncbi:MULTISPECIES: hypothetical protein [unclassified Streptomyces]|uniref:hypothetical protein n=1 Tax=unclassified Streptomyces TaxID=2593676 RepID=UPI00344B70A3